MHEIINIVDQLQNLTINELNLDILQDILAKTQSQKCTEKVNQNWRELAEKLWNILFQTIDDTEKQLLCSTCFYSILVHIENQSEYFDEIARVLDADLSAENETEMLRVLSLMYGMFQSSFFIKNKEDIPVLGSILESMFKTLLRLSCKYAWYTFLVFKIISCFKKVVGTNYQNYIFAEENQIKLLNMVNENWENPITGVRDLNKLIFQTLLSVLDNSLHSKTVQEISGFPWNKAKYLMLCEVIAQGSKPAIQIVKGNDCIDGIVNSLYKPGLVSAGADMYFSILKSLRNETEWCNLFLEKLTIVFQSESSKAIDNFTNYWCLTTFKKFPALMKVILDEKKISDTSQLSIMKQGNKLGLLEKDWKCDIFKQKVIPALENKNAPIRILAFDILCISQSKTLPTKLEYELIYDYICNNVNSDETVLRLHMLNSLKFFFIRLHSAFLNRTKRDYDSDIELVDFCSKLQKLVTTFLSWKGNYQRKITTIKICDLVLTYLSGTPSKKQRHVRKLPELTLIQYLKENRNWLLKDEFVRQLLDLLEDPAEDVREKVSNILLNHYLDELKDTQIFNSLLDKAKKSIQSKFFFEISCGQSMFKLITNILLKTRNTNTEIKTAEEIFLCAFNDLSSELNLKRDISSSIVSGKQLHSLLGILYSVFNVCLQNNYKLEIEKKIFHELLDKLEFISKQFAWEDESVSADFSKMSDKVQEIVEKSGLNSNKDDRTKISGMHQIVLNCMWLNVKVCCELSSVIVRYVEDADICYKCLNTITHVLETSRHKGAIEAAGSALGEAIHHLTAKDQGTNLSELPRKLLEEKLSILIAEAGKMASVSRRGAGLSIMVHRIVASDTRRGKPLFHYFMKTLLLTCNEIEDVPRDKTKEKDIDNEKDLPKAIFIHFLTRIVIDSSLASDIMHYSSNLGALAFHNLTSNYWQIRNAALQLYGALLPKLIGQRKSTGDDTIATVASDEFRTHLPDLWMYMLEQLKKENTSDIVLSHSNLVPILNILANSAKRYTLSFGLKDSENLYNNLFLSLMALLGSPIYTVRKLTARSLYNNFSFKTPLSIILNVQNYSENQLHGHLLLVKYFHREINEIEYGNLKSHFSRLMLTKIHSYVCKDIFDEIFAECVDLNNIKDIMMKNSYEPGLQVWINNKVNKLITEGNIEGIINVLTLIPESKQTELYFNSLLKRIRCDTETSEEGLKKLGNFLLNSDKKFQSGVLWEILNEISSKVELDVDFKVIEAYLKLNNYRVSYKLRYMIVFVAKYVSERDITLEIVKLINEMSLQGFEMRFVAALANRQFSSVLYKLSNSVKVQVLKTNIILLQDEDDEIRNISVDLYKILANTQQSFHPFVCLKHLLNNIFLEKLFLDDKAAISLLCDEILKVLESFSTNVDDYNPFSNECQNMYIEIDILKSILKDLQSS